MALVSGHKNPWNGVCIHGTSGATIHKGEQVNPKCSSCKAMGRDGSS